MQVCGSLEDIYQANKPYGQMTKVIFVRHGESTSNVANIFYDDQMVPLSETGLKQVDATADELASEHIDAVYSSPYTRALETAKHITKPHNLEVLTDERLCEVDNGTFKGKEKTPENLELYYQDWQDHSKKI